MNIIIAGIAIGFIIAMFIACIGVIRYEDTKIKARKRAIVLTTLLCVLTVVVSLTVATSHAKYKSMVEVEKYKMAKEMIEDSLSNNDTTARERTELVGRAIDKNGELKDKQYEGRRWYGFYIDEEVLELEPISIDN